MSDQFTLPTLRVNEIGEYIRHNCCARRFRLEIDQRREARKVPFYERFFNPLDPVLQSQGELREEEWSKMLTDAGFSQLVGADTSPKKVFRWEEFVALIQDISPGKNVFAREVTITGRIGCFDLKGRIDFLLILWERGHARLRIVETKASRRDRTYQRVQVATYSMLARRHQTQIVINGKTLPESAIEAVVARIDENSNSPQPILTLPPFNLAMEEADLTALLRDGGPLQRYAQAQLDSLDYRLEPKCDTCVFATHCFPESALHRRLHLVGLSPSSIRVLESHAVRNIDELADLDPTGVNASQIRTDPTFSESLERLIVKAQCRRRNLPGPKPTDVFDVEGIPDSGKGALPNHEINGQRLVRIYLSVDYDYGENRIGALSAHVTSSEGFLHTGFTKDSTGKFSPHPLPVEHPKASGLEDLTTAPVVSGCDVLKIKSSPWTGNYAADNSVEAELVAEFINNLVDAIGEIADDNEAPIHFYVWSRGEIRRLVESCSRTNTSLLTHLKHLLGCRESLEQLIFTSLQEEVARRYALAWTGTGLSVTTSLRWFGSSYHWRRKIGRDTVDLDRVFTQDIFDFKTTLGTIDDAQWASPKSDPQTKYLFEIRSRFFDSLPAPYWRALWGTLPDPEILRKHDAKLADAITRYNEARKPNYLREYLKARCQALRWIEERSGFKNNEIVKERVSISELRNFKLATADLGDACVDFLRLDQHVSMSDWIAQHLAPPQTRVSMFMSLPIRNVIVSEDRTTFTATLEPEEYGTTLAALSENCSLGEDSWVRFTPRPDGPRAGQSVGLLHKLGCTCIIESIDWNSGAISCRVIYQKEADRYRLKSFSPVQRWDHALLDESPSQYTSVRVDDRLSLARGSRVFSWFDPVSPKMPPLRPESSATMQKLDLLLRALGPDGSCDLAESQARAIREGFETRTHLLQGPPGTGKTRTTAIAFWLRCLLTHEVGDCIAIAGTTHTAVDTLVKRIVDLQGVVTKAAQEYGLRVPRIKILRISSHAAGPIPRIEYVDPKKSTPFAKAVKDSIVVIAGTTGKVLQAGQTLLDAQRFPSQDGKFLKALVVDEASMLKLPDFLALTTLLHLDGRIIASGDHRQLSPIVSHDWENEDRPPTVLFKPFVSSYDAIFELARSGVLPDSAVKYSALSFSFRLPYSIRELIAKIYKLDAIELKGRPAEPPKELFSSKDWLAEIWAPNGGVFLIVHNERLSRRSNRAELEIIETILSKCPDGIEDSVAVITPHRAQRSLLSKQLAGNPAVAMIDTVERLQGGEKPTVIVSATASDPSAISINAEFLLNLNRANVAFSRAQERLIIVCSESLLEHVPPEIEDYQSAMLWKSLRVYCTRTVAEGTTPTCNFVVYAPGT